MSLFRKALGAFVELDPKPAPQPLYATPERTRVHRTGAEPTPALTTADVAKFEQHFEQLFDASNLPGPDYFEFQKAMDALEDDVPAEDARMRVAYTTLKVQGLTPAKLVETARQYIAIVEADRKALEAEVAAKTKAEIDPLQAEVDQQQMALADMEHTIRELQAMIPERRAAVDAAKAKLAQTKERLGANITGYQLACTAMVQRIEQDITKITNTLGQ